MKTDTGIHKYINYIPLSVTIINMEFIDNFDLRNFKGNRDYPRIISYSSPLHLIRGKFQHTHYYNLQENAFITIPHNCKIDESCANNVGIIKFEEREAFLGKLIKYIKYTKNDIKPHKCCVCLDSKIGIYMPCCNFKQFVCETCINELYINDNYSCPCCRKMYILDLQKSFNL